VIAVWMLYCLGIGLAFVIVGYALERSLLLAGRPTRAAWLLALIGSYLIPVAAWLRPQHSQTMPPTGIIETAPNTPTGTPSFVSGTEPSVASSFTLSDLDRPLRWAWLTATFALLVVLVISVTRIITMRRRWRPGTLNGRAVLISSNVGPAVVGLVSFRIVVPQWAFELPEAERELMLAHEEQHIHARDPVLLAATLLAVLVAPWNAAAWWQWRRLRRAVEMDCDGRVLRDGRSAAEYGALLLSVGRRQSRRLLAAAAFGEPVSFLESRIRRIVAGVPRWRWIRVATAAMLAGAAISIACEAPRPVGPFTAAPDITAGHVLAESVVDEPPERVFAPDPIYPELLRRAGIRGAVVMQAILDTTGRVEPASLKVLVRAHPALEESAKQALLATQYRPARVHGRAVRVLIQTAYTWVEPGTAHVYSRIAVESLAIYSGQRFRAAIERYARGSTAKWMIPSLLEASGPAMDVFLVADAKLRVYRSSAATLYYLGNARPTGAIDVADLKSAAPFFSPGHDSWGVVDPQELHGLVRDNVRVIWIHHDPAPQDTVPALGTQRYLRDQTDVIQRRTELVSRLAHQSHPEMFTSRSAQGAVAVVLDSREQLLAHAARREGTRAGPRVQAGVYASESCLDVLTRLLPQYKGVPWAQTGCSIDRQANVVVYWGQLLKP